MATSGLLVEIRRKIYSAARNFAHIYFARLSIKESKQNLCNVSIFSLRNDVCEYTLSVVLSEPDKQDLFII